MSVTGVDILSGDFGILFECFSPHCHMHGAVLIREGALKRSSRETLRGPRPQPAASPTPCFTLPICHQEKGALKK